MFNLFKRVFQGSPEKQLRAAAGRGDTAKVNSLIDAGADVNQPSGWGMTALMWATFGPVALQVPIVQALVAAGADVNAKDDRGETVLSHASSCSELAELLREAGAVDDESSIDESDEDGSNEEYESSDDSESNEDDSSEYESSDDSND